MTRRLNVRVDHSCCVGNAMCLATAPGVFAHNDQRQSEVVDLEGEDANRGATETNRFGDGFGSGDHRYRLEGSDHLRDPGIRPLGRGKVLAPQILAVGPRHPATTMGTPLGGHGESGLEGSLGRKII